MLTEKNVPTDKQKWSYYKSRAKKKFDVYPSAYANAWAAGEYKDAGGGWRKEEGTEPLDTVDEYDEVDEMNTTASAGGEYQTPYAFASKKKKKKNMIPKYYEPAIVEQLLSRMSDTIKKLDEISYKDFKNDPSSTFKQKINTGIKEVSKQLYEIESTVNRLSKLKTEIGADQQIFLKQTFQRFNKISERLLRLENKIREIGK